MAIGANYTYKMQSDFWMAKVSLVTGQMKIGVGEYLDATLTITITFMVGRMLLVSTDHLTHYMIMEKTFFVDLLEQ